MKTLYGLAQMEAINHDQDKMHQDFLLHVRRKKEIWLFHTDKYFKLNWNFIWEVSLTKHKYSAFYNSDRHFVGSNVTLKTICPHFVKRIITNTLKFQNNIVFDSVPFRTLYFTIIPLQGLVYVHMQIIKCYLESYSNKLPAAFEKNRFQNMQDLVCRVEFLISIE